MDDRTIYITDHTYRQGWLALTSEGRTWAVNVADIRQWEHYTSTHIVDLVLANSQTITVRSTEDRPVDVLADTLHKVTLGEPVTW